MQAHRSILGLAFVAFAACHPAHDPPPPGPGTQGSDEPIGADEGKLGPMTHEGTPGASVDESEYGAKSPPDIIGGVGGGAATGGGGGVGGITGGIGGVGGMSGVGGTSGGAGGTGISGTGH